MNFVTDEQRRAAFANMRYGSQPVLVPVAVSREVSPQDVHLAPRNKSGLEIIGQAGEKLAGSVVGTWPGVDGTGRAVLDAEIEPKSNAISGLWPETNLEELLVGITTATYPDSSEGRGEGDTGHYYVVVPSREVV
jgi:hypothetical protein